MKILLIPLDYHKHESEPLLFTDLLNAFNVENEAIIFTDIESAISFEPNLVFYQGSLTLNECKLIKEKTGCYFTMWTGDCRYVPMHSLIDMKEVVDQYYLPFSGELLDTYEKLLGKPCTFIWEPLHNWKVIKPKELLTGNVTFIGHNYETMPGGEQRKEIREYLNGKVEDLIWTDGVPNNTLPGLYSDSFIVIAENNYYDIDEYFTPRNLLAMANSCCVARWFPECERHFFNFGACVYYKNKYELLEVINYLKSNHDVRNRISNQGHELMKERYTYTNWAKQYIKRLRW